MQSYLAPAWAWCSEHRYVSLAIATGVAMLVVLGSGNSFNTSTATTASDDDELVALDQFDDLADEPGTESRPSVTSVRTTPAEHHARFDDLTPFFGNANPPGTGIVTATFEGASRPVETGPVWLAGTIETDDVPAQTPFDPVTPAFLPQASGPLLTPQ